MSTQHPTDETKKYLVFGQTPVSWTKKLKGAFVSETIYEGRTYFSSRSVSISTGSREYVHASMWNGAGNCTVKISVEGDDSVFVSCTCKAFRKVTVCEHVWATILAAERRGYLGRIGEMPAPVIKRNQQLEPIIEKPEETISSPKKPQPARKHQAKPERRSIWLDCVRSRWH